MATLHTRRPSNRPHAATLALVPSVMLALLTGCGDGTGPDDDRDYRSDMRAFVEGIADYARAENPAFLIIPQNGHDLFTVDGDPEGPVAGSYLAAIDGAGREDLFYGYDADDRPTPEADRAEMIAFLDIAEAAGVEALVTDYVSTPAQVDDAYALNAARGYTSFAADHRDLDNIPGYPAEPVDVNTDDVSALSAARNFLYLLDASAFGSKEAVLSALEATSYDLLIIDAFYDGTEPLTAADVTRLRTKAGGGSRLVVAYMSIGEAEDYRYYWESAWRRGSPAWLAAENPDWPGNYKVRYWDPDWQAVIFGGADSYTDRLLAAGFDGAYLDIIDAFEYFE